MTNLVHKANVLIMFPNNQTASLLARRIVNEVSNVHFYMPSDIHEQTLTDIHEQP